MTNVLRQDDVSTKLRLPSLDPVTLYHTLDPGGGGGGWHDLREEYSP